MKNTLLLLTVSLLLLGCGGEQIQTYQAPKEMVVAPYTQSEQEVHTHAAPETGFSAELPEGWTEVPGSGMRMVSYRIEGTGIDFYLISLAMGDLTSNVNRWRGQVGLQPASPDEIEAETLALQVGGQDLQYIEIYNEAEGRGIIAAILDRSPQYWYFTAKGTVEELKANAPDIRRFLESLEMQ